jgi:hypothetical protein
LVVAKVKERLAVSKRAEQKIDTERYDVKKLNEKDVKEQYRVIIRKKCAVLENLEWGHQREHGTILDRTSAFRPKRV